MSVEQHLNRLLRSLFYVMLSCVTLSPASARIWKPTPDAIAHDYASIQDNRANGELVILMWFVPNMVAPSISGAQALAATFDNYVVISVVHAHISQVSGTVSFDDVPTLEARDQSGKPLALMAMDALPPTTIGALATMETVFRQSAGAFGKGMKMFIFDSGGVHSCTKGGMSVPFAGETYTWQTPIPGCPHA